MPATSPADEPRDDWSRGQPARGDGESGHGDGRPRQGRRRARAHASGTPVGPALAAVGFTALLTLALVLGAVVPYGAYAVVIFVVQVLYVFTWTVAARPPAGRIVAGVGVAAAAVADLLAVSVDPPSLAPLAYVTAAAFGVAVVGQLIRPAGRERVTESLGSTLAVVVGAVALASLVVLSRHPLGKQSIVACLVAAGVAVAVARLTDLVAPRPRLASNVSRGGAGVLLGLLVGAGVAAVAGSLVGGVTVGAAAAAGLATALVAVVVDLSAGYAEAGRQLEGEPSARWPAGPMQGPFAAFALAAPAAYAASALLLWNHP